jgi:hypothetical protein
MTKAPRDGPPYRENEASVHDTRLRWRIAGRPMRSEDVKALARGAVVG